MAEPPTPAAPAGPAITITRVFDAPREQAWREWTEPERFADWFGGSEAEVPVYTVSMDVRAGGEWRATMFAGPDRREIRWQGVYREVARPKRLVFTLSDQPGEDADELVTVVLTDLGDGRTEMRFEQRGRMSARRYERAEEGMVVLLRPHGGASGRRPGRLSGDGAAVRRRVAPREVVAALAALDRPSRAARYEHLAVIPLGA